MGATTDEVKTFIEHLRTVHFALLATCLALLAASLPSPPGDLKLAKRDLGRISTAIKSNELTNIVNHSFLLAARGNGVWKAKDNGTFAYLLRYRIENNQIKLYTSLNRNSSISLEEQAIPAIDSQIGFTRSCEGIVIANIDQQRFEVSLDQNTPLQQFSALWDCLSNVKSIGVIEAIYDDTSAIKLGPAMKEGFHNNFLSITPVKGKMDDIKETILKLSYPAMYLRFSSEGNLILEFEPSMGDAAVSNFGKTPIQYVSDNNFKGALKKSDDKTIDNVFTMPFVVPLSTKALSIKAQEAIIKEFFPGIAPGTFERRFPQLVNWVEGKEDRPISVLIEDIQSDLERANDSFEVLGVKIPLALIAKVGILVIILIEIYFSLHLRRLRQIFLKADTLPAFPWIGIYSDIVSKSVFTIALIGIPASVVFLLIVESWGLFGLSISVVLTTAFVVVHTMLGIVLVSFWRSWPSIGSMAKDHD